MGIENFESFPFSIPKRPNPWLKELKDNLKEDSNEIKTLKSILETSYLHKDTDCFGYELSKIYSITNQELENRFLNKKKEITRQNSRQQKNIRVQERYGFYLVNNPSETDSIIKNGFVCNKNEEYSNNLLGCSSRGIHLMKHLDVMLLDEYVRQSKSLTIILTKYIANNIYYMTPGIHHKSSYPSFDHDCHMSKNYINTNDKIDLIFKNSLIYLYEYDQNGNIDPKPSQLCPIAVLNYSYNKSLKPSQRFMSLNGIFLDSNQFDKERVSNQTKNYVNQSRDPRMALRNSTNQIRNNQSFSEKNSNLENSINSSKHVSTENIKIDDKTNNQSSGQIENISPILNLYPNAKTYKQNHYGILQKPNFKKNFPTRPRRINLYTINNKLNSNKRSLININPQSKTKSFKSMPIKTQETEKTAIESIKTQLKISLLENAFKNGNTQSNLELTKNNQITNNNEKNKIILKNFQNVSNFDHKNQSFSIDNLISNSSNTTRNAQVLNNFTNPKEFTKDVKVSNQNGFYIDSLIKNSANNGHYKENKEVVLNEMLTYSNLPQQQLPYFLPSFSNQPYFSHQPNNWPLSTPYQNYPNFVNNHFQNQLGFFNPNQTAPQNYPYFF
ncbi:unnamed protein product [Brachionus calyciflorus]|uniref:TASOR pseudo-PARP domain-containing protein n=1 Tax=Brachionus calyciflorus TaxID=104777 RepID=A0A813NVC2_9BILA|nr:unnamed protein product [Brachionus calyciflorus]